MMAVRLEVALNSRTPEEHPAVPRTPAEIARDVVATCAAGAEVVHLHAYDHDGNETLDGRCCADVLRAIRAMNRNVPISLTTSAAIVGDPELRLRLVRAWTELPELVTANQGEEGIVELCDYLIGRGVGIEAGLLTLADAEAFVESGLADRCVRVLLEPLDADPAVAVAHAQAMEDTLTEAAISLEQIHHGEGIASWSVSARALERGHGMRTGLEDTTVHADGSSPVDNADLVRAAVALIRTSRA
jgi:uncharacterized protein (DUF849 family)